MAHTQEILNLYKRVGETPLERILRFKEENPEYADMPMTYAGRLDPAAEGVLVVLAGAARFRKDEFLSLDKEYEMDILWGFQTDTYDALGIVQATGTVPVHIREALEGELQKLVGRHVQEYPPYSSRTVGGKPLFQWAREGKTASASKIIEIYSAQCTAFGTITGRDILGRVSGIIRTVSGDFRQEQALQSWERALEGNDGAAYPILTVRISCSSGTYMRGIAEGLGVISGSGAIALGIRRVRVGDMHFGESAK